MDISKLRQEIQKEFEREWRPWLHRDGMEKFVNNIIDQTIDECIKLSDEIEGSFSHTEFNEWRAFKQFRNTLRDDI